MGGPSRECNDTTNVLVNLAATGNRPNSARQLEKVTLHGLGSIIGHAVSEDTYHFNCLIIEMKSSKLSLIF